MPARIHLVPVEDMPETAELVVDEPGSSRSVAERLREPHTGSPLALLLRLGTMNSPDRAALVESKQQGRRVEVEVELRTFTGPLLANIQSVAVAEVGPISMEPGRVEVALTVHTLPFAAIERPEEAGPPVTSTQIFGFDV